MNCLARRVSSLVLMTMPLLGVQSHAMDDSCVTVVSGQIFCDSFSDGSLQDESPVSWKPAFNAGQLDIEDESLTIRNPIGPAFATIDGDVDDVEFTDISLRAQVRLRENDFLGIAVRWNEALDRSYSGFLSAEQARLGIGGSPRVSLGEVDVDFDVTEVDVMIQLDAFDDIIRFWAWPVDTAMPSIPTLFAQHEEVPDGKIFLWTGALDGNRRQTDGAFRFVRAATQPIRDRKEGDFDGNGRLDLADINLLSQEIRSGTPTGAFDLNSDTTVDTADLRIWVEDLKRSWVGDANLDGEFNSGDLVNVFASGRYETGIGAGWAEGDWDASGFFDSGDLVAAFAGGGYEQGPRTAGNAVPEPASIVMLMAGVIAFVSVSRSRGKRV